MAFLKIKVLALSFNFYFKQRPLFIYIAVVNYFFSSYATAFSKEFNWVFLSNENTSHEW